MSYVKVRRRELTTAEKLYFPSIVKGLGNTFRHLFKLGGTATTTMQYPEEKWTVAQGYRGVPSLVKDKAGREKCVACSLCEYVCPPRAISIIPKEIDGNVEKAPEVFDIDMLRCIFCGYCQEVCPEEAIFLMKDYSLTGTSRAEMIYGKEKLLALGGVHNDKIRKWKRKADEARDQGVQP